VNAVELFEKGVWATGRAEDWEDKDEEFDFEGIEDESSDTDSWQWVTSFTLFFNNYDIILRFYIIYAWLNI